MADFEAVKKELEGRGYRVQIFPWGCMTGWGPTTRSSGTGSRRRVLPAGLPWGRMFILPPPMAWRRQGRSSTSTARATGWLPHSSAMGKSILSSAATSWPLHTRRPSGGRGTSPAPEMPSVWEKRHPAPFAGIVAMTARARIASAGAWWCCGGP